MNLRSKRLSPLALLYPSENMLTLKASSSWSMESRILSAISPSSSSSNYNFPFSVVVAFRQRFSTLSTLKLRSGNNTFGKSTFGFSSPSPSPSLHPGLSFPFFFYSVLHFFVQRGSDFDGSTRCIGCRNFDYVCF